MSAAFERGQFATRRPLGVEVPFSMVVAGTVVRGRIDAVFAAGDDYLVVDWKTGDIARADPIQLAIYAHAWAELVGVPVQRVRRGSSTSWPTGWWCPKRCRLGSSGRPPSRG